MSEQDQNDILEPGEEAQRTLREGFQHLRKMTQQYNALLSKKDEPDSDRV